MGTPHFGVSLAKAFDARVLEAGNAAMGLWVRAGAWCTEHRNGGHLPAAMARRMGTPAQVRKLLAVGLWVEAGDGYQFTTWAEDGNRSAAEAAEFSARRAASGRTGGTASGAARRAKRTSSGGEVDATSTSTDLEVDVTSTRTEPQSEVENMGHTPCDQREREAGASARAKPFPIPIPFSSPSPREGRAGATLPPDLAAVVDAWSDGAGTRPTRKELAAILGDARELLGNGDALDDVLDGAQQAGREGFATIRVSVRKQQARRRPRLNDAVVQRDDEWAALKAAAAEADRTVEGQTVPPLRAVGGTS